jgi:hypothetical protein
VALIGLDIDGVLTLTGYKARPGNVIISGRVLADYDGFAKKLAQICPVYIRGVGDRTDWRAEAEWKILMIRRLGVTRYTESEPKIAALIRKACPKVEVLVPSQSKGKSADPAWSIA